MLPPKITNEDRIRAGVRAVEARRNRAEIKKKLANGETSYLQAIYSDNPDIARMKVYELLKSIPKVGEIRARAIMDRVGISANRRVGGLGKIQIMKLRSEEHTSELQSH